MCKVEVRGWCQGCMFAFEDDGMALLLGYDSQFTRFSCNVGAVDRPIEEQ